MHVRAYNYWVSLLDGRDFPVDRGSRARRRRRISRRTACCSISPAAATIRRCPTSARAIREECGLDDDMRTIADVPSRSLLSRLTDHYHADHRQPRAGRLRGRVRQPARRNDLLSRHPDALLVGRRHDRLHLRRDQLEARRRSAGGRRRCPPTMLPGRVRTSRLPIVEPDTEHRRRAPPVGSRRAGRWRRPAAEPTSI